MLLVRLHCPEELINFYFAVKSVRGGRDTFKYPHGRLRNWLGSFPSDMAARKRIQRLITGWRKWETDNNLKIMDITSGGHQLNITTEYGTDYLAVEVQKASHRISMDIALTTPDVMISRQLNKASLSLRRLVKKRQAPKEGGRSTKRETDLSSLPKSTSVALNDALKYAVPCHPKLKKPAITDWQVFPSRSDQTRAEIWTKHKGDNIGIATGNKLSDGRLLVVIDVDPKNGGDESGLALPETLKVRTGSGGSHYYFSTDRQFRSGGNVFGAGLDFKAAGGLVVAPGSIHENGSEYVMEVDAAIAHLPVELERYLTEYMAGSGVVSDGKRHDSIRRMAGAMIGQGHTDEETTAKLLDSAAKWGLEETGFIERLVAWTRNRENKKVRIAA